jgi:DNA-binding MarR family transcriptional regulator
MSELAQRGHVTLGTMTVMINKLVKKGYTKRRRDAKDRRVVHVSLTARGRKIEKLHEEDHRRIIDMIMAVLTESEQKEIIRLIQKIATALG